MPDTLESSHRPPSTKRRQGGAELVALLAMMTSLTAFSIDSMLPALPQIAHDLGIARENDRQLIVSVLLLGLAAGQLLYGPVSDSVGRKPAMYAGFAVFLAGDVLCLVAADFPMLLAGRFLQGLGAAGPRILSMAMVRDLFSGRAMARVMSLTTSVFILVPVIAPAIGQGLLLIGSWHLIFVVLLAQGVAGLTWLAWRQPETLPLGRRAAFRARRIGRAFLEVARTRVTVGYMLAAGLVSGAFIGWLTSCQQVLQELYGLGRMFPLFFAMLALTFGVASLVNARLVIRLGMRRLAGSALAVMSSLSVVFLAVAFAAGGRPPLWALMGYMLVIFFCIGLLFGNFNALAMEPMGHIAGVAAAVVGSVTSFLSLVLGTGLGQAYDGSVRPLVAGFAILGMASAGCMVFAERGRPTSAV
ncbi:MAG TPA: multidrug effflux MFS transporter [Kofleriaceae bacterium]|nr:multidrug effflux MFS transporter [Kofleriaceae bacterium]